MTVAPGPISVARGLIEDTKPTAKRISMERARRVRSQRAALKHALRSGDCFLDAVLREPPNYAVGMALGDVLRSVPRFGPARCSRVARSAGIELDQEIGRLSAAEVERLISTLKPFTGRWRHGASRDVGGDEPRFPDTGALPAVLAGKVAARGGDTQSARRPGGSSRSSGRS